MTLDVVPPPDVTATWSACSFFGGINSDSETTIQKLRLRNYDSETTPPKLRFEKAHQTQAHRSVSKFNTKTRQTPHHADFSGGGGVRGNNSATGWVGDNDVGVQRFPRVAFSCKGAVWPFH